jgi:hypothetical protein
MPLRSVDVGCNYGLPQTMMPMIPLPGCRPYLFPPHFPRPCSDRMGRQNDGCAPVDSGLVVTNLYSSMGEVRQDGDELWLRSAESEIWSLGLNGPA